MGKVGHLLEDPRIPTCKKWVERSGQLLLVQDFQILLGVERTKLLAVRMSYFLAIISTTVHLTLAPSSVKTTLGPVGRSGMSGVGGASHRHCCNNRVHGPVTRTLARSSTVVD